MASNPTQDYSSAPIVTRRERTILLAAVFIISICALTYELIVATLSSYLLGDSITQFSFTIGFFLFAMGVGSLLSRRIKRHTLRWFIIVEVSIAIFGGTSAILLYATFSTVDIYYYLVMMSISLAIGICVGLEIPLLTRIVADRGALSTALADVLSIDYIGALVGSLAFPVILLPLLGVTQTAFLMGLFNVLVAALCLHTFRRKLSPTWTSRLWIASGIAAAIMLIGAVASTDVVRYLEQQLYASNIIYTEQTPYQRIVMTSSGRDFRLYLNGNLQFSSIDEYRYHEVLVHPVMSIPRSHERILVLGGGDGFVARELLKYEDVQEIIVVDLDPSITELAVNSPILQRLTLNSMTDSRVTIVNADAYRYIQESDELFNVIIIDLPDPNNESLSKLYSDTFYRLLQQRLTPDGAFVTQATSPYFARRSFWIIANTIESTGLQSIALHTYVPTFGEWGFIIGTPRTPPELTVPDIELRYLTPDVLIATRIFDPDIADSAEYDGVNTLNNPILPRFYVQDWRHWN
ncbi:MAG: polyamine aminopropyltransferase [Anaerolineae bacterium]|nr:polyamine aminopropyltransferase [Anaerolineae bacterium]